MFERYNFGARVQKLKFIYSKHFFVFLRIKILEKARNNYMTLKSTNSTEKKVKLTAILILLNMHSSITVNI